MSVTKKPKPSFKPRAKPTAAAREPEKWFKRLLWVVSVIFAGFLIGLGAKIVADLPIITENYQDVEHYIVQKDTYATLKSDLSKQESLDQEITQELEQKQFALQEARQNTNNARDTFDNWLATRSVTEQSAHNPEVIRRTQELDQLKNTEQRLQNELNVIEKRQLDRRHTIDQIKSQIDALETQAFAIKDKADKQVELRIFLYRLALTLPLLILAWFLFRHYRHSNAWPFVWGFVFFALFAFFVELVPYLPNYGGYVHYGVGIILTALVGRYAIKAMTTYLERKRLEESLSTTERQSSMDYDEAHKKIARGICPSCERELNFGNLDLDFCPHCGIHLFTHCGRCDARNSTFNHYCFKCGCNNREQHHAPNIQDNIMGYEPIPQSSTPSSMP